MNFISIVVESSGSRKHEKCEKTIIVLIPCKGIALAPRHTGIFNTGLGLELGFYLDSQDFDVAFSVYF